MSSISLAHDDDHGHETGSINPRRSTTGGCGSRSPTPATRAREEEEEEEGWTLDIGDATGKPKGLLPKTRKSRKFVYWYTSTVFV